MAEKGACAGQRCPIGRKRARDQHRRRALAHVEQQRRRRQPLAAGAQHVGGADIARSDRAQITRAGKPREKQAERDRAEEIGPKQHQRRSDPRLDDQLWRPFPVTRAT
jgi:hypothetical protein